MPRNGATVTTYASIKPKKYSRRGTSIFLWVPTIASTAYLPTRTELSAGTNITGAIAAINGFTLTNQPIDAPDMADTFDAQITGNDKADSSDLTLYEDEVEADLETLLAKGENGFIVILRKGDIPENASMDVYPIEIASQSPAYTTDNDAAKFSVVFTINDRPVQGAPVPAAT